MYIKKINIKNFRQLKDVELNFDESLNLLAGSNNSGKTTLLELFNILFNKESFKIDDFNNQIRAEMDRNFTQYKNGDIDNEVLKKQMYADKITVDMKIEYKDEDNISLIGEYINELMCENKQVYLKVECLLDTRNVDEIAKLTQIPLIINYYYTDRNFMINEKVEPKNFKEKFNYKVINAKRDVNDTTNEKKNLLSKNLHNIVQDNDDWNSIIDGIKNSIEDVGSDNSSTDLENVFEELKTGVLKNLITDYETTNGGNIKDLKTVLELNSSEILKMLSNSVLLKYDFDGVMLNEGSQGLGYSNLLYILMEIYKYENAVDEKRVNILFIEEPESHMHPAMERRLIKYLKNDKDYLMQKIITSHSKEMIEFVQLESVKVFMCKDNQTEIFDLNKYCQLHKEESKFIKKFVRVISDIFYSDRIIMFEGDGERLYLDHVINTNDLYVKLKEKYIAYVQVGGRHAINYKSLLDFLQVKTVIFADMDYGKKNKLKNLGSIDIEKLKSTNQTIITMLQEDLVKKINAKVISDSYVNNQDIILFTQSEKDGFARSFEDALLYKMYKEKLSIDDVLTSIPKDKWKQFNESELNIFEITNTNSKTTHLLNRSMSIKDSKTDFIYDYIENDIKEVPDYIDRGLKWLMKE